MQTIKHSFAGLLVSTTVLLLCGCPAEKSNTQVSERLKAILDDAGFPSTAEELQQLAPRPSATAKLQLLLTRSYNYPCRPDDLEALDALLIIAADTPRATLQRNWEPGTAMQAPATAAIRAAIRLNLTRARKTLEAGEYRGLRVYLEQFHNLGSWCYDDPLLLSTLTGFICDGIVFEIMQASLDKLDTADIRGVDRLLDSRDAAIRSAVGKAMIFDSALLYISYCRLSGSDAGRAELYRQLIGSSGRAPEEAELALLDELMPSCLSLETAAAKYAAMDEFERRAVILQLCREFPDAAQLMPINMLFMRQTEAIARLRCLKAAMEAELCRRKNGDYPDGVPGADPFTGKPLGYVKGEKIYSAGADMIDGNEDDIVFRLTSGERPE